MRSPRRGRELRRARERGVRARAVGAMARLDVDQLIDASDDAAAEVRAAFASALGGVPRRADAETLLVRLIDDRDPDVRAAAWSSFVAVAKADKKRLAARAAADSAAQVRRAALPAIDDDDLLLQLAARDDSPEVRTW